MNTAVNSDPEMNSSAVTPPIRVERALTEPVAFACLLWPAVVGLFLLHGQAEYQLLRYGLYVWLAIFHLAAYSGGRGYGFGNAMLFTSGCVALACLTHPTPWTLIWLPVLLVGLVAAQRVRL